LELGNFPLSEAAAERLEAVEEGGLDDDEDLSDAFDSAALTPDETRLDESMTRLTDPFRTHGPLIVDSSNNDPNMGPRRSSRPHKPNSKYANVAKTVGWANACNDLTLAEACASEVHTDLQPTTNDANFWEPAPKSIRDVLKMHEGIV
jgi:hypothetical protein